MMDNSLRQNSFFDQYYLLNATLGKFNFLEGNYSKAKDFYNKTLDQTNLPAEKDFIQRMIGKIDEYEKLKLN